MKFEDALKLVRRNTFQYGEAVRVAIICSSKAKLAVAWDEARFQIEASSLKLEQANYATRTLHLERGAKIRFFVVEDNMDLYALAGSSFTHMLFLDGEYPRETTSYLRPLLRSPTLEADKLLWCEFVTL